MVAEQRSEARQDATRNLVAVGVDGTARSSGAIRYAADEAVRGGAVLRLVHVSPWYVPMAPLPLTLEDLQTTAREVLEAATREALDRQSVLPLETEHETGSRVTGLLKGASGARLLVLGRETRSGVERMAAGATTTSVAARAESTVVVVPDSWDGSAAHGRVLLGIKRAATSPYLLARAFKLARERGATLVVVHAWRMPDAYTDLIARRVRPEEWRAEGLRMLTSLLTPWRAEYPDVEVEMNVDHGTAVDVLVRHSARADAVVVVRHPRDATRPRSLGSVPRAMLRYSAAPVEVVPDGPEEDLVPGLVLEEDGQILR
ncbi:universal stress protein [Nocardioides sp. zg-DK7169]|uniref:universal stress protein n=1 Tax=Nocardioides sp. zg-DK7169 TaxID=2736600 RepID=UPI001556D65E|nr:universal stress protein [Nocardioides sp. zg-DK7169]NPC96891.1 universal stress protein [Nocardioides sp. zg-DK7169]